MKGRRLNRREFLMATGLTTVGIAMAACAAPPAAAPEEGVEGAAAPAQEDIVLDIRSIQPEYENAERQIWAIYEAENPGVTVNLFSINEDQGDAFEAKMAGGYVPAFDVHVRVNASNAANYVNLLEEDFEWFDRWQYDVRNAFTELTGVPGVFTLDPYQGFMFTWQYHQDLMEELGFDPRNDVKTMDDLKAFLAEGAAAVDAHPDLEHFWDQGWHNWVWGQNYWGMMPLAQADGQRDRLRQSWLGEITDPAEDPFRHTFEFFKEAYQSEWMPENFWLREWETDMEASYIAKKSVMMLHGPWTWDKMLAADPSAQQQGIPSTPPAAGQDDWVQFMSPLNVDAGFNIPIGNKEKPEWDQVLHAYNWYFSPPTVKLRAEMEGRAILYDLDEPLELEGPQWLGILQEFLPGGFYEDVVIATEQTGDQAAAKFKNEDAGDYFNWQWAEVYADVVQDNMTVEEGLAWFHEQVAQDFSIS